MKCRKTNRCIAGFYDRYKVSIEKERKEKLFLMTPPPPQLQCQECHAHTRARKNTHLPSHDPPRAPHARVGVGVGG